MLDIIIYLAVLVILVLLVWYLLTQLPLPEPAGQIILAGQTPPLRLR